MGTMEIPRLLVNMSLPLMASLLVQSLYNIVDGIFVARLSEDALTATSIAYPVQLLMIAVGVGTAVGINSLLSRLLGAKKFDEVTAAAATGLLLALISSVLFIFLGIFTPDFFADLFTKNETVAELCRQYLQICMIFCTGTFVETMVQRFLQAAGNTFLSMISLIVGAVTNIILDPIMIFGLLGFPALGIRGAAIATVIGQWLGAATALFLNTKWNKEIRVTFHGFRLDPDMIKRIYKVGFPTILTQAMGSVMISAMNAILMPYSSTAVAFFGAYYKLQNFLFMPINGLGQAALPIVGYNFGSKNKDRIRQVLKAAIMAAVVMAAAAMVIFLIFPRQLLLLFSASDDMLALGIPALRIISITFLFFSVTTVIGFSLTGLGNGLVNMISCVLRQLVLLVPSAWLLGKAGGVGMIWFAFWISEAVAMVYSIFSLKREFAVKVRSL